MQRHLNAPKVVANDCTVAEANLDGNRTLRSCLASPTSPSTSCATRSCIGYLEHAARHGTPRPESQAIRAHVPAVLRSFSTNWQNAFRTGVTEHRIKELCRGYVSATIECHY